jgi:hypothetical protein
VKGPRRVALSALPGPEQLLEIEGETARYFLEDQQRDVMLCGAEFTYLLLTYADPELRGRGKRVISIGRVMYAE